MAGTLDITTLDPAFSQNFSERFAYYAVYNSLVAYDENFNLVPELAVGWETTGRMASAMPWSRRASSTALGCRT